MTEEIEDDGHIRVICRVRPANSRERKMSAGNCILVNEDEASIQLESKGDQKSFCFDYSASDGVTQQEIFERVGLPITQRCIDGYNGTILCYGQTGSGKTYTIFGSAPGVVKKNFDNCPNRGLVPRVLEYLWTTIGHDPSYRFACSIYEIYQEKIFDLLDPSIAGGGFAVSSAPALTVREDAELGVYVEGCNEQVVQSLEDVNQLLSQGYKYRHVSETAMNRQSSRSHAVFQLLIDRSESNKVTGITRIVKSRFSMVDLAGSERQTGTLVSGMRLKEANTINKSLTCLGRVINDLIATPNLRGKRKRHINYRDSKLTFLLRDSLGGNSKTALIATVSPSETCYGETLSTLYFAQRCMGVMNSARVNETTTGSVLALQAEIASLRAQVEAFRGSKRASGSMLSTGNHSPSAILDNRRRLSANRGMFFPSSPVLTTDKKNIMSGLAVQHVNTSSPPDNRDDTASWKAKVDGSGVVTHIKPLSPIASHRIVRMSSGQYSIESSDTNTRSSKSSAACSQDKENCHVNGGNYGYDGGIRVITPPGRKVQISKLIEDNTLLLRINRELEDALEEREAAIDKSEKALAASVDDLERCKYELEVAMETSNGRFSHTKILLGTLQEMKAENEGLNMEACTLRCAKDSLQAQLENEVNLRQELSHQLECLQEENAEQVVIISTLKVQLSDSNSKVHNLERELSLMEHKFKDESNRADQLQMNLGAMKIKLKRQSLAMSKLSTSSASTLETQSSHTLSSDTTLFPSLCAVNQTDETRNPEQRRGSCVITASDGGAIHYLSSVSGPSVSSCGVFEPIAQLDAGTTLSDACTNSMHDLATPEYFTSLNRTGRVAECVHTSEGIESTGLYENADFDDDVHRDDSDHTVEHDSFSSDSDTDVQSMGTNDTFDTVVQSGSDETVQTSDTVVRDQDGHDDVDDDEDNDENRYSATVVQEKEDRWSATIVKGFRNIAGYRAASPSRATMTSQLRPSRHIIVQATSTASSLTEHGMYEDNCQHNQAEVEDGIDEEGDTRLKKKRKKTTFLKKIKKNVGGFFGVPPERKCDAKKKNDDIFRDPCLHPPPAPSNLTASFVENTHREIVKLRWRMIADSRDDSSNSTSQTLLNLCRFEVEHCVKYAELGSFPFTSLGTSQSPEFTTSVKEFPGSLIYYRVRAISMGVKGMWSPLVSIKTLPSFNQPTLHHILKFEAPFDENGVMFWLGTQGGEKEYTNPQLSGRVNVQTSCKWYASDAAIYVESRLDTPPKYDRSKPCSWVEVDLGLERQLIPNYYCLRGYDKMKEILVNWELQARCRKEDEWVTLKRHLKDTKVEMTGPLAVASWALEGINDPYRYFRILQLDNFGKNSKNLSCSGIELYGTLLQTEVGKRASMEGIRRASAVCNDHLS